MRMRGVLVLLVVLSLVAAPVAMAVDGCSGMGSLCDAPCSASGVSTPASDPVLVPVANLVRLALARIPAGSLQTPDAPPKSLLSA